MPEYQCVHAGNGSNGLIYSKIGFPLIGLIDRPRREAYPWHNWKHAQIQVLFSEEQMSCAR